MPKVCFARLFHCLNRRHKIYFIDDKLDVLREGCFKYFELGGQCIEGPVSLLSGLVLYHTYKMLPINQSLASAYSIKASPRMLFLHFFAVAFYSIWAMFTHPRLVPGTYPDEKPRYAVARLDEYPGLVIKSFAVVCIHLRELPSTLADVILPTVLDSVRRVRTITLVRNSMVVINHDIPHYIDLSLEYSVIPSCNYHPCIFVISHKLDSLWLV